MVFHDGSGSHIRCHLSQLSSRLSVAKQMEASLEEWGGFATREMQRIYEMDRGEFSQYFKERSRRFRTDCSSQMPHSEYMIRGGLSVGLGKVGRSLDGWCLPH